MGKHIDERRFAHIASTNESVLRNGRLRTLHHVRTGDYKSQFRQEERPAVYQQEGQKKAAKDDVRVSQVADQLE